MTPYEKAEAKRMAETRKRAKALLTALEKLRTKYGQLKIVVDNDCWWFENIEEHEDLSEVSKRFDVGPEELACMLAIGLGFDAGRP